MNAELKTRIEQAIRQFETGDLTRNGLNLFETLGYITERRASLREPSYTEFRDSYIEEKLFHEARAKVSDWKYVDLLFQLSKEEVLKQTSLFDTKKIENTIIETYLFFVIELNNRQYTRTELSQITREMNKLFPMPVMILFKYGNLITLSVINRRLHKRDETKDVLEKVTLIKDINIQEPHRAHIEILFDLSFDKLNEKYQVTNFVELHNAWQKTLDTKELNKRFFSELANWYFWATSRVVFPDDEIKDKDIRNATGIIRLITRLMFIWFLKEKNLISDNLFDEKKLKKALKFSDKNQSTYYKAILQNLFFATLNTEMGTRRFRSKQEGGRNGHYFIHNVLRYEDQFINARESLTKYFDPVPFLNGGLFECLDKQVERNGKLVNVRIDGFSDRTDNVIRIPDELFFSEKEKIIDLSQVYGTPKKSKEKVRGVINILNSYKFTITENTPVEEEVALDPELLGKVFENLLANYNPETQTTARKQTGSFYTPREIVNYMVDESLLAYLKQQLIDDESTEANLRDLLSYSENPNPFQEKDTTTLIRAIDTIKILDPACGSGAFPMGVLHKLVHVLHKIDPRNEQWENRQLEKVDNLISEAGGITDTKTREKVIADLEETRKGVVEAFENNELDYGRKLFLIENCIYGVDIQPIAVQIAKLRFFISLIVDQRTNSENENLGIRPLPNLETKFVAANTLIALDKEEANLFTNPEIEKKKEQLKNVRHDYFEARTPKRKTNCREKDKQLREELTRILTNEHLLQPEEAKKLAAWDPYDQNSSAPFFDMEWMFGLNEGVDVVIGNPPYHQLSKDPSASNIYKNYLKQRFGTSGGRLNTFIFFTHIGIEFLKPNGVITYIIPNTILTQDYYRDTRKLLLDKTILNQIVSYNKLPFENAVVENVTIFAIKDTSQNYSIKHFYDSLESINLDKEKLKSDFLKSDTFSFNFGSNEITDLINQGTIPLSSICSINQAIALKGDKSLSLRESNPKGKFDKLLDGRNINKYSIDWGGVYLDYNLDRIHSCKTRDIFTTKEKLMFRRVSSKLIFTYDNEQYFALNTIVVVNLKSSKDSQLKYLLGILNSNLIDYYYRNKHKSTKTVFSEIQARSVGELPIKKGKDEYQKMISTIVDYILLLKNTNSDTSFLERLIDSMVYELYLPASIQSAGCEVLKHLGNLPELREEWDDGKKLQVIDKVYKELSDPGHPVSTAILKMDTIEEIRIIEGKK
jgi:hypothetical protein